LLTYEVLTAFFLEAGFLVMLFGWNKVGLHFFSTVMVAIGTLISTFWILASNSWMQTPQGFEIINGQVIPTDWLAVIFNPSFPYRLMHMATAAFVARRSSSVPRRPGTCCAARTTRRSAPCSRWPCGWR
jgi:cytochrome d ubiquinol oxidase subunit I